MISFPNCKINLGLHVTDERSDGFHNIETIFYPVPIRDALELIPSQSTTLKITGLTLENNSSNLCIRAYELLKKDHPDLPAIEIHLHKVIPTGAGLGGGSADGAFTLTMINRQFDLKIPQEKLLQYASILGSDCSFFIINTPCLATGRGELLQPIDFDLKGYFLVIITPELHINTGAAFKMIITQKPRSSLRDIIKTPVHKWKDLLNNDFETPLFKMHPVLKSIKENLYNEGAVYASMSGSGSTVFGLFKSDIDDNKFDPVNYFYKKIKL